jgi:hypothetical protein
VVLHQLLCVWGRGMAGKQQRQQVRG